MRLPGALAVLPFLLASCCCPPAQTVQLEDKCFLRNDYQQLPRPDGKLVRSAFRTRFTRVFAGFLAGVGDRYANHLEGQEERTVVHDWARNQGAPVNAQAIWLTRDWEENWVSRDELDRMAAKGVVPVLMLYYFGADVSRYDVLKHRRDWFFYLVKVAALASIDHPVLVVLEPEFNDGSNPEGTLITRWPGFNEIVIDGIYLLRSLAPNVLVGVCPGDFGLRDLEPSVGELAHYSDFIAFQEMRASTRPSQITDQSEDVTASALAFSGYLHRTFDKPVLFAYMAVSTHDPDNGRWEQYQADIVANFFTRYQDFRDQGVFGFLYFMLFDDPSHVGYFEDAETQFGLVDKHGQPKAGWHQFKASLEAIRKDLFRPVD